MKTPSDELDSLLNVLADEESSEQREACEARLAEILRADAPARKRYRQFAQLHSALMWDYAASAASPTESEREKPSGKIRDFRGWKALLGMAATIVFAALVAVFWMTSRKMPSRNIARLEMATGAVSWSDDAGAQKAGLESGSRLAAGTLIVEGASGSAQLRFEDGTVLMLTGDAEVAFSDDGQKRLVLRRGAFTARVARQPAGKPMLVRTTTAEIEVIGTVFSLASEPNQTALNVESGSVRLRRLADGRAVDVPANRLAVASFDVRAEMQTQPQSTPPNEWRRSFDGPPAPDCKGQWFAGTSDAPGRMRALPYVAGHAPDGRLVVHHGVSVRAAAGGNSGLVTLANGSVLHVRYRTERPSGLKLFLSCERAEGTFGGNFEFALERANRAPDAGGWITADVPISPVRALMPEEHPSVDGKRVRTLILHSYESDVALEVAEIGISQPQ